MHTLPIEKLLEAIGDARLVLIGEASHGTHEFYRTRAELTQALIRERGFTHVAVEADWPDAYRANRWLRAHNAGRPEDERTGFYGLDLYSLHRSIEHVLAYLDKVDPEAAARARERYSCFEMFGEDPQAYGWASTLGMSKTCEGEVTAQLVEMLQYKDFSAEQNARLVANAETYYRAMFGKRANCWNVRDRHMMETLEALLDHAGPESRAVVWAHNSHLGDARATEMSARGELNLGQLVRERFGEAAWLVGFTTHAGSVTAARDWGDPAERRRVRPSLEGSWERLFHDTALERFLLLLRHEPLPGERLERAIGVIYRPETERFDDVVRIESGHAVLDADLRVPQRAAGLVIFAHGSGSSRFSPRNRAVAGVLEEGGFATLLCDLLTKKEESEDQYTREHRFNIGLLGRRVVDAVDWAQAQPELRALPVATFGASTGAAAALIAAAERPERVRAVISRGGRPDLAGEALENVKAPTLLIVGGDDAVVIGLNQEAARRMRAPVELEIVPGATHLFEEPGALEKVARLAASWCQRYL